MSSKHLIDYIINNDNTKASDEFENLMADKVGDLVDKRKVEIANNLFNETEDSTDATDDSEELTELGYAERKAKRRAKLFKKQGDADYKKRRANRKIRVAARQNRNITSEFELGENIDLLKDIVETKKDQTYEFEDGSSVEVDVQTASLLLIVYESLDGSNKKKFEEKVYKSKKSFLELVDFAQKKIG